MKLSEQRELFPPTWHTLPVGACIWFSYTSTQWMRARVVFSCRKNLVVEPLAGELRRTIGLRWSQIFWQPGDMLAPDRGSGNRSGATTRRQLSPQPVVVHDDRYGEIDGETATWLQAARRDRDA